MITSSRARLGALTLTGVLSLALVTGCSGGSDGKPDAGRTPGAASSAAGDGSAPGKALSAEELAELIVGAGDVDGFEVAEPGEDDIFGGAWEDVRIEGGDGCDPLARALSGSPVGEAETHLSRQVTQQRPTASGEDDDLSLHDAIRLDVTTVTLAAYEGDGAERAVRSVSEAVTSCSEGFTVTLPGVEPSAYDRIASEKGAPAEGADETVAYGLTGEPFEEGGPATTVHGQVARHGNTVVTYLTVNLGNMAEGKPYEVSAPVVAAQAKKLA
ncbi:hypothetical protein [Streptomyces abyssomicinicus]|uniref:hypothetical protein n=1 Tax=Streptomyces abyssomicinicus TaxID=574929 RepID=UPI00124FC989|nr:hypothetical protein [Streptomyces abyssomicinicus]